MPTTSPDFSEFFWSKASAERAAAHLNAKGYDCTVRYARRADLSHDWLVTAKFREAA